VPGARGWTGRDRHGDPIGQVFWVQGRCEMVLGNEGEGDFVKPLSIGATAIWDRTKGVCLAMTGRVERAPTRSAPGQGASAAARQQGVAPDLEWAGRRNKDDFYDPDRHIGESADHRRVVFDPLFGGRGVMRLVVTGMSLITPRGEVDLLGDATEPHRTELSRGGAMSPVYAAARRPSGRVGQ
jgi:hypothetical protein